MCETVKSGMGALDYCRLQASYPCLVSIAEFFDCNADMKPPEASSKIYHLPTQGTLKLKSYTKFLTSLDTDQGKEGKLGNAFLDLLVSMGECELDEKKIDHFARETYAVMAGLVENEYRSTVARHSAAMFREGKKRFNYAGRHIANSLKYLSKAEAAVEPEIEQLVEGALNFDPSRKALERLRNRLEEIEAWNAAMIHPRLRKSSQERTLAEKFKYERRVWRYLPALPSSHELEHDAVSSLEKTIVSFAHKPFIGNPAHREGRQYLKGKRAATSAAINRFISRVFLAATGQSITAANVKTIRLRIAEQKKAASKPKLLQPTQLQPRG